ncbi:hypothetical protein KL86CLO1_11172 [uncultured Eubacteriales bacterium]|uniref:Uncharacterized protein n=1 Tax=uncultured Eubacteriales bacterium TaxID=172733 RepID=A0A212JIP9_9FIRM|nr:hypothetical protein KL86CLO1_11172 [uncultured Eubacteriales bacterium]
MNAKELWRIPVPSTAVGSAQMLYAGADVLLRFDYSDETHNDMEFNTGILLKTVLGFKHDSEGFATTTMDAYDRLVEIAESDWVAEYQKANPRIADLFHIKHYAIFLKSCGLYEFIAKSYAIQKVREGGLNDLF